MIILSAATLAAGLVVLAASVFGGEVPAFLPVITFATAAIVYLARRIPRFLRVLVGMLAAAHMLLLAILLVAAAGLVPEGSPTTCRPSRRRSAPAPSRPSVYGLVLRAGRPHDHGNRRPLLRIPRRQHRAPSVYRHGARHGRQHRHDVPGGADRHQPRPGRAEGSPQFLLARPLQLLPGPERRRLLVSAPVDLRAARHRARGHSP